MRMLLLQFSVLLLPQLCVGCASGSRATFTMRDVRLLDDYGGVVAPAGEGSNVYATPVESIVFLPERRVLTDEDFAAIFPAVRRMDPLSLTLDGHRITDRSVPLLIKLNSLRGVSLDGTAVTPAGLRELAKARQNRARVR